MTEQPHQENKEPRPGAPQRPTGNELDTAGKSLSEALRMSFVILKVIMVVLGVAFLASGFKTVGPNERALVLRFGKIRGVGEQRILGPGPHWIFPYPIDEIVKIPVATAVNLPINSFWYYERPEDVISGQRRPVRPDQPLDPIRDGYCLTRNEKRPSTLSAGPMQATFAAQEQAEAGAGGNDYNIVHTKWQLTYRIDDPERFFKNIEVRDVKPGDVYFNVLTASITPLLRSVFENAVVTAMVNYTIDEAIASQDRIPKHVARLVQEKLDTMESGIRVVSVQLTKSEPPAQVRDAFEASTKASQTSQKAITDARKYAETTLSEAAGSVAEKLFKALHDETVSKQTKELLWSQVAGTARETIADARAYRTQTVESAKADADYLERLLPEYLQRPKIVLQRIYLDALEKILDNADEKFVVQKAGNTKGTELRVLVNRDPSLKPKTTQEQQNK
jgi:modulator of FtsH protease HflK